MNYEKLGNITLYNCDCLNLMKLTPDDYYDLSIVDPPYGIGLGKKKTIGKKGNMNYIATTYKQSNWDSNIPDKKYFQEIFRISKNQIIFGGNYFIEYLNNTRCVLFWSKQYIPAGFSMADCEMAWTSFDASAKMIRVPIEHNNISNNKEKAKLKAKIHQAQKPVKLYEWILDNYAKPGQKIFDSHFGSLSIGIACHNLGFELTACELDKDYYEAAKKRLQTHQMQKTIFDYIK